MSANRLLVKYHVVFISTYITTADTNIDKVLQIITFATIHWKL